MIFSVKSTNKAQTIRPLIINDKAYCIESGILWRKKGQFSPIPNSTHKKSRLSASFLSASAYMLEYLRMGLPLRFFVDQLKLEFHDNDPKSHTY